MDWGDMQFENLKRVAETFPDKNLIFTEGCAESFNMGRMNAWALGERYGKSMINDFNAGTVGWTDWNVLLDETGGPNHVRIFALLLYMAIQKQDNCIILTLIIISGIFQNSFALVPNAL
jgi:glucosylceramidase